VNFLKQNSDYALRMIVNLAEAYQRNEVVSAHRLAEEESVSRQFTAKILQKLAKAGLVESLMGPTGGYKLKTRPEEISMAQVIVAMQGPVCLNKCSPGIASCPRQPKCPISRVVHELENDIINKLSNRSIKDIIDNNGKGI
jgi:Rrf2 family transcriptional regulator, iron-sulfur cluster assembly transcription factor